MNKNNFIHVSNNHKTYNIAMTFYAVALNILPVGVPSILFIL